MIEPQLKNLRRLAIDVIVARETTAIAEESLRLALDGNIAKGQAVTFAARMGITPQHLSDIRKGRRAFTLALMERIAK